MTAVYAQNEYEIVRACGYIKDDKYLAWYYGLPVHKIEKIRAKALARKGNRTENRAFKEVSEASDFNRERYHKKMMEQGSKRLLESLLVFFSEREKSLRHAPKP